jgi:hypothetical protein
MSSRAIRRAATIAAAVVMATVSAAYAADTATHAHSAAVRAHASSGPTYSVSFSPNHPGSSSALTFTISDAQQPTASTVTLPAGTVLNRKAVGDCSAPPACDPSTQVGTGTASAQYQQYTIPLSFAMFNTSTGVAVIIDVPNGSPKIFTPTWSGNSLAIPYPNGTYKGQPIVTTKISLAFNKIGSGRKAFIRTPSTCPKAGWASTASLQFSATGTTTPLNASAKCSLAKKKKSKKKKKKS